ncbi:RNA-directed DNA polymerase from mobile element jockey [Trichonephila clavipes]|nr:RNA-directed DNA polymerase from mobile element jockey [Trichonephila clavipes]
MKLNIKRFHINRLERPTGGGSGLALLIRDVKYQNITIPQMSTNLEIQYISIFWGKHKLNIFTMYHPSNQGCLPDSFLDLAAANVPSIFIEDLNAKHTSWRCSVINSRGCDLLNAADDRALLFPNDGSPTDHSFSYNTAEALDIALARAVVFPFCHWSVLGSIGSDYLPIKSELKKTRKSILTREMFWNFGKADSRAFAELTKKDFTSLPLSNQLNINWLNFKEVVICNAWKTISRGNLKLFKATYMHNDPCLRPKVDKRDRLFQKLKQINNDSIRVEFNKTNAEVKRLYAAKKRASWHEICSKIDARTNKSKLWTIAKYLSRDRPWRSATPLLTVDGFPPNDDRATANSHYQKMSRLTFNKGDKHTER